MSSQQNRQDASVDVTRLQDELASLRFKLDVRQSVLQHTTLTAPVAGIVKHLRAKAVGAVLRIGDERTQIPSTDVALQIEVKVLPPDVGLLRTRCRC
jgi:adhesin transport system membrane fusion protein